MKKILKSIGLKPGRDLGEWMSLAQAIQEQRNEAKKTRARNITRTTALYAAAELNSDVYLIMNNAGLDWPKFASSVGILANTRAGSVPDDVDLHRFFEETLERASSENSELKELSTSVLAFFILSDIASNPIASNPDYEGEISSRLSDHGLNIDQAIKNLSKLVKQENQVADGGFGSVGFGEDKFAAGAIKTGSLNSGSINSASVNSDGTEVNITSDEGSEHIAQSISGTWIFRADSSQFSLSENLFPKKYDRWKMVRDPGFNVDDVVWFWQDGDANETGLYGWGYVAEPPDDDSVRVHYEERFDPYCSRRVLDDFDLDLPVLTEIPNLTFLPITEIQAEKLTSALEKLGVGVLPLPAPSRYAETTQSVLDSTTESEESTIDDEELGASLSDDYLVEHVKNALLWAERNPLSSNKLGYISADGAFLGILKTRSSSSSFNKLREILLRGGAVIEEPSFEDSSVGSRISISPALAESLATIREAFPEGRFISGATLVTAVLFAPERIVPEFANNRDDLSPQWRSEAQDKWEAYLRENNDGFHETWSNVISDLSSRYRDFGREDPYYFADQLNFEEIDTRGSADYPSHKPLAWVESDAVAVIGRSDIQSHSNRDSLNAKEQAELFATLLIAKDVEPPFAIGLLGDWGVGKTFFMRLMQEKVESIAGKNAQAEANAESISRAAQIEFNAWHYVDSDLWASLASHIFDGLSNELRGRGDTVESIRRELRKKIRSSEQEQEEAKAAVTEAQKSRKEAASQLAIHKAKRDQVQEESETSRLKRVWDAVLRVKPVPGNAEQKDWPDLEAMKNQAQSVAKDLGITGVIDTAESAQQVYKQLKDIQARGSALTVAISAAFTGGRILISGIVIAIVLALVLALPWLLEQIDLAIRSDSARSSSVLGPVLQIVTVIGSIMTWVSKNLSKVSSGLSYLEAIQHEILYPRIPLTKPSKKEVKLKDQLQELNAKIATGEHRLEEADRQIAEAQAEIQRIDSGGLVYDFLEGRVRDSRYLDRLGLISVIRKDFESLAELLLDWRKYGSQDIGEIPKDRSSQESWDTRPIERIILYIDDLDRCPPERVVEVLQAVHLILAFKLFVVVVAVDPRWLERSLNEAYNSRLPLVDEQPLKNGQYRFSAQNYLEKIFQIPFSLPTMDVDGYRKLVSKMTNQPKTRLGSSQDDSFAVTTQLQNSNDVGQAPVPHNLTDSTLDESKTELPRSQRPSDSTDSSSQILADTIQERRQERELKVQEQADAQKRISAMLLRDWEEQLIASLHPFIETPRIAKRFINIYRLLRVRAANDENEFERFIDREMGEYRAVLILLAINVGFAETGPRLLEDMMTIVTQKSSLLDWLLDASQYYQKAWSRINSERIEQNTQSGLALPPSDKENQFKNLEQSAIEIHRRLGFVKDQLEESGATLLEDDLSTCRKWSRDVGRYSFGWHLKWAD